MPNLERNQQEEFLNEMRKFLLTERDKKRLEKICEEIERIWRSCRPPYPYPPHDDIHCERVEERIYQLIPREDMKQALSSEEIFLLLASVWLHDVGMCPELFQDDPTGLRDPDEVRARDSEVRKEHADRSARYIKENGRRFNLSGVEINHLMKICLLHRHKAYKELNLEPWVEDNVHRPLLIAYLRLADALHIPQRDEAREFKIYLSLGMGPISRFHWFKSRYVHNIEISPNEFKITIVLKRPPSILPDDIKPLEIVLKKEVQDELDSIKDILAKGKLSLYLTVECTSNEVLDISEDDERQLKELLRNIELFDPTLTPNASSVIDNVLKQIRLFLEPPSEPNESIRYLNDYRRFVLADILEKRPCHVFLWKIADLLEEKLKASDGDRERIKNIEKKINEWERKRREALREIPKIAYGILADSFPVLLYGYSHTIVKCIEYYLKEKKKDIDIYICEGRTKTEYRYNNRLDYCDGIKYAEELKKIEKKVNDELENQGIKEKVRVKILYITDSCTSNLFSNHKVSKVLFGANGIGLNGRVSHTLGHLAIADMAAIYRIPIYIIADSMKIGYLRERPELQRGNQWLTTDIEFESKVADFEIYNPREDVVPPDRIELIFTEKGFTKPIEIRRYSENNNRTAV